MSFTDTGLVPGQEYRYRHLRHATPSATRPAATSPPSPSRRGHRGASAYAAAGRRRPARQLLALRRRQRGDGVDLAGKDDLIPEHRRHARHRRCADRRRGHGRNLLGTSTGTVANTASTLVQPADSLQHRGLVPDHHHRAARSSATATGIDGTADLTATATCTWTTSAGCLRRRPRQQRPIPLHRQHHHQVQRRPVAPRRWPPSAPTACSCSSTAQLVAGADRRDVRVAWSHGLLAHRRRQPDQLAQPSDQQLPRRRDRRGRRLPEPCSALAQVQDALRGRGPHGTPIERGADGRLHRQRPTDLTVSVDGSGRRTRTAPSPPTPGTSATAAPAPVPRRRTPTPPPAPTPCS